MKRALPEGRKISALVKTRLQHKKAHAKDRIANGFSSYTVVSAVYNVEKYLHDFFTSMVRQTLDFENNIYLIMVDDGSTDRSAAIIKLWQKRYPNNITYLYKENGGQASARNMGLPLVKTDWVTFTDPDDFVDKNYFLEVDKSLAKCKDDNIEMVCCKYVLFNEANKTISDTHPLTYKFQKIAVKNITSLGDFIQLSIATVFINHDALCGTTFDTNMKPNGEDALFILNYIDKIDSGNVLFLSAPMYFYRKREDSTSSLDKAWDQKSKFTCVPEKYAMLIMELVKNNVALPDHVQITLLYEMTWYFRQLIDHDERIAFLTKNERQYFIYLFKYLLSNVSAKTIYGFKRKPLWDFYRVCMMIYFKNCHPNYTALYIDEIDYKNKRFSLHYYSSANTYFMAESKGNTILEVSKKIRTHTFADRAIVFRYGLIFDVSNVSDSQNINFNIKNQKICISCNQSWIDGNTIALKNIFNSTQNQSHKEHTECWVFIDRNTQADDSAEHLYRYVRRVDPKRQIYFILEKHSHDWERLEKEGFHLVPFLSDQHKIAYAECQCIISSHADAYIYAPFKDGAYTNKQYIFLQHGVIKDDLSSWLNSKKIDIFVTSTYAEYSSIASDYTKYKFSRSHVAPTGLPRHDALLEIEQKIQSKRQILIMPTWRLSLVGKVERGNRRVYNTEFSNTTYAKLWKSFLHSEDLHKFAIEFDYSVVFFPHANMQPYLEDFSVPTYIKCKTHMSGTIQTLFAESKVMITDYSSVAFEMAYLCKSVLYYQFDKDFVFGGGHLTQKGYFDYERDGFGPVVETEEALLHELEILLKNNGKPAPEYLHRMERTFPFRDGRCCERVYNAICRLEKPQRDYFSEIACLYDQAVSASRHNQRADAIELWKRFYDVSSPEVHEEMYSCLDNIPVKKYTSS